MEEIIKGLGLVAGIVLIASFAAIIFLSFDSDDKQGGRKFWLFNLVPISIFFPSNHTPENSKYVKLSITLMLISIPFLVLSVIA